MADLRVGTLRLTGGSAASPDPEPLLEAIARRDADRSVLIVRTLAVTRDDPETARAAIDAARVSAVHPARSSVPADAGSVCFADEAELLVCLSRDILAEVAIDRWWWTSRMPSFAPSAGETLAVVWMRAPRWVPTVLAELEQQHPTTAERAIAQLGPACAMVLAAILDEFPSLRTEAAAVAWDEPRGAAPTPRSRSAGAPPEDIVDSAAARLLRVAAEISGRRFASASDGVPSAVAGLPLAAARIADLVAAELPPTRRDGVGSEDLDDAEVAVTLGIRHPSLAHRDGEGQSEEADHVPSPIADLDRERVIRRLSPATGSAPAPPTLPRVPLWAGGGPSIRSEIASMLFAINLIRWFHLVDAAGPGATGWGIVEAAGRSLLRPLPASRRAALTRDPLFDLLADLDARPPHTAARVDLRAAMAPVRRWLRSEGLPARTFTRPGVVVSSRTHIDVVFDLEHIDLAARVAGLDQDPGWCPELGRIVLFHFEDPR